MTQKSYFIILNQKVSRNREKTKIVYESMSRNRKKKILETGEEKKVFSEE